MSNDPSSVCVEAAKTHITCGLAQETDLHFSSNSLHDVQCLYFQHLLIIFENYLCAVVHVLYYL